MHRCAYLHSCCQRICVRLATDSEELDLLGPAFVAGFRELSATLGDTTCDDDPSPPAQLLHQAAFNDRDQCARSPALSLVAHDRHFAAYFSDRGRRSLGSSIVGSQGSTHTQKLPSLARNPRRRCIVRSTRHRHPAPWGRPDRFLEWPASACPDSVSEQSRGCRRSTGQAVNTGKPAVIRWPTSPSACAGSSTVTATQLWSTLR